MDLDTIKREWKKLETEKKALVLLGIVVFAVLIYAFNPFHSTSDIQYVQGPTESPATTSTPPVVTSNNSTVSNNTSSTNITNGTNVTSQISSDVAKNIAAGANPGFTAGQPTQGTVIVNNTVVSVWIVPITNNMAVSKTVYVDSTTGMIVQVP